MSSILVPVSPGELLDKITILEIKQERIADPAKLAHVAQELALLLRVRDEHVPPSPELGRLTDELREVNRRLWVIEDAIRLCEKRRQFDAQFVELARSVYHTNDRRSDIKREINELLRAGIFEVKSYA
jgi:hypothetical protein